MKGAGFLSLNCSDGGVKSSASSSSFHPNIRYNAKLAIPANSDTLPKRLLNGRHPGFCSVETFFFSIYTS
jgi:hypothetical protein